MDSIEVTIDDEQSIPHEEDQNLLAFAEMDFNLKEEVLDEEEEAADKNTPNDQQSHNASVEVLWEAAVEDESNKKEGPIAMIGDRSRSASYTDVNGAAVAKEKSASPAPALIDPPKKVRGRPKIHINPPRKSYYVPVAERKKLEKQSKQDDYDENASMDDEEGVRMAVKQEEMDSTDKDGKEGADARRSSRSTSRPAKFRDSIKSDASTKKNIKDKSEMKRSKSASRPAKDKDSMEELNVSITKRGRARSEMKRSRSASRPAKGKDSMEESGGATKKKGRARSELRRSSRDVSRPSMYEESMEESDDDEPLMKKPRRNSTKNKGNGRLDDSNIGSIRFDVDNVSELNVRFSRKVQVGGVTWRARIEKQEGNESVSLSLYSPSAYCNVPQWSIDAKIDYIILNADSAKNVVESYSDLFSFRADEGEAECVFDAISWSELMDERKGFIKDDKITFEIRFSVVKSTGIRAAPQIDFTDPNVPSNDGILIIDGENIYVNKGILALQSPLFHKMFYEESEENVKNGFTLMNVDREEFIEMLRVIYPSRQKITDENVKFLLELGNGFEIKLILDLAENHLITSKACKLSTKLLLSEQYRLFNLQDHCIAELKSIKDVNRIKNSPEYAHLSDGIKQRLQSTIDDIIYDRFVEFDD